MKRFALPYLLLATAVFLAPALVLVGCESLTAAGVTGSPLILAPTSSSFSTLVSGKMDDSTTTLSGSSGGAASAGGTHGGAAPPSGTPAAATTATAPAPDIGTPPLEPTVNTYEDTDPHLYWNGEWAAWEGSSASAGTSRWTLNAGASVTIKFAGTGISWIGAMGETYGVANVYVDGDLWATLDLYGDGVNRDQRKIWGVGTLPYDTHKVTIECTGLPNSVNPAGAVVVVDAFDVVGTAEY